MCDTDKEQPPEQSIKLSDLYQRMLNETIELEQTIVDILQQSKWLLIAAIPLLTVSRRPDYWL